MMDKYKCKICDKEVKNNNLAISIHVKKHSLTLLEYLVQYESLKIPICPFCKSRQVVKKSYSKFGKTCGSKECFKLYCKSRKLLLKLRKKLVKEE